MNLSTDTNKKEKATRLMDYLLRLASLRSKTTRTIDEYDEILWLSDIPKSKGCYVKAWGGEEDYDSDIWIEIQNMTEPKLPNIPEVCKEWVNRATLYNKNEIPELMTEIKQESINPDWTEISDKPKYITNVINIKDKPFVDRKWSDFLENSWFPWTDEYSKWEQIHKVYSILFSIYQSQLKLGEEYELVLGIGLLTWRTPTGQRVRRHLIVANAVIDFEARLGKFTVKQLPQGPHVRCELDMLDIEDQPTRAEGEAKAMLENYSGDPWDKNTVEGVLQSLLHSLNPNGEYSGSLEAKQIKTSEKVIVEYAPALILRKRSDKGLSDSIKKIMLKIDQNGAITEELSDLLEITEGENSFQSEEIINEKELNHEEDVYFPKPSNEEQRRIVYKIQNANGVLVQGPPGTGKSHTIANLVCHLLATGKRILITAKTPRALQVLETLMAPELLPLCINLLGSGLEERRSLEFSVQGILQKNEDWNEQKAQEEFESKRKHLKSLREEKAKNDLRLREIKESETHVQSVADGAYQGTAARIAEGIERDSKQYEWFKDKPYVGESFSIDEIELRKILRVVRLYDEERRKKSELLLPGDLPSASEFVDMVTKIENYESEEKIYEKTADDQYLIQLNNLENNQIDEILSTLSQYVDMKRRILLLAPEWVQEALRDVVGGVTEEWNDLSDSTAGIIALLEPKVGLADETTVTFPVEVNERELLLDAEELKRHLENGGNLGWGFFRPRVVKDRRYILDQVKVNGRFCLDAKLMDSLINVISVRNDLKKVWDKWHEKTAEKVKMEGSYSSQIKKLQSLLNVLRETLAIKDNQEKCRQTMANTGCLVEEILQDQRRMEMYMASCRVAITRHKKNEIKTKISKIEIDMINLYNEGKYNDIIMGISFAISKRDKDEYIRIENAIKKIKEENGEIQKAEIAANKMRSIVPQLIMDIEQSYNDPSWDARVSYIKNAWCWAQAKVWLEKYLNKDDVPSLIVRQRQLDKEIDQTIASLASLRAWSYCFSRLKESHRRHMEAWKQSMRKLGKGTGKYASLHRREAQKHLNECRDAVPAWVMPLHRVWDTVDPEPGIFDVVIVDEASQCGFEALPLFYLAKKILIVGDDKQISPDAVGVSRETVQHLMEQYLFDFEFKSSFDVENSLFDHGKLRYGTQRVTLCEHFRCMPEIIEFSNDLCYSDTPLIPLRQYGPNRLNPIEHVFVEGGYRIGQNNHVINEPEAEAIVNKIVELCKDKKYNKKTMGVIILQGEAQAGLIENKLLERLGAAEMEERKLICGNPYSFQGDERDIIFLSMVAATNERIGALAKGGDERRFNVAASRAKDQMILFHSVTRNDLSNYCLRRRLLEFFEGIKKPEIAGVDLSELENRASRDNRSIIRPPQPFESWFEVDVALELLKREYDIRAQYEIAGKYIDLVVEGGKSRLAIECDGDYWHGLENYESDMQRQRRLERCGWEFFRIRESEFYANKTKTLEKLWSSLEERDIFPKSKKGEIIQDEENDIDEESERESEEYDEQEYSLSGEEPQGKEAPISRRVNEVFPAEISDAILAVLKQCPNYSCTIDSLTTRVLRQLGVVTRGKPREEFEKRVMRILVTLDNKDMVEKYRSKNKRVRLVQ